jgi:3-deoxy-manno-octulosonate cytidylyltransferase (CMP-KDO synthetase)
MNVVVIPLRLKSSRFPHKLMTPFNGRPLFWYAVDSALESKADEIVITGDDGVFVNSLNEYRKKRDVWSRLHYHAIMHADNGTQRTALALADYKKCENVVNLQADEPMIPGWAVDRVFDALSEHQLVTLATPSRLNDRGNPDTVKVVFDANKSALYFSRSPIPFGDDQEAIVNTFTHLGIYGYRRSTLRMLVNCEPAYVTEKLEQLAWVYAGFKIHVIVENALSNCVSINSAHDIQRFQAYLDSTTKAEA